jgi:hypothetical protein
MIIASDPRITNQQKYLSGVSLVKKQWVRPRAEWDHDHCAFCWAKFAGAEMPDALHEGYVTAEGEHWVCPTCFADFSSNLSMARRIVPNYSLKRTAASRHGVNSNSFAAAAA